APPAGPAGTEAGTGDEVEIIDEAETSEPGPKPTGSSSDHGLSSEISSDEELGVGSGDGAGKSGIELREFRPIHKGGWLDLRSFIERNGPIQLQVASTFEIKLSEATEDEIDGYVAGGRLHIVSATGTPVDLAGMLEANPRHRFILRDDGSVAGPLAPLPFFQP